MDAQKYMLRCLELAQKASDEDEVPIGAAVVDPESGEIVSEAYNLSEHKLDATAHAETLAIRRACEKLGVNRLRGLDLYVTLEPCTMCAAAISIARIKTLYFGAYDPKGGAVVNGVRFTTLRPVITGQKSAAEFWKPNAAKFLKGSFAASAENFSDWH